MPDMTGTRLESTQEVHAYDLRCAAKDQAGEALRATGASALGTGIQVRTHHGGVGNKTAEQWKWWGIKANWDKN